MMSAGRGLGDASSFADHIRRAKGPGSDVPSVLGLGVPPHEEVIVDLLGHVVHQEPIHHAYSQTRLKSPYLRLGELSYLFVVGATLSQHVYKDFAVTALGQVFLKHGEGTFPIRAPSLSSSP
jgi:hypothetical protein